jgi:amino acid permease
LRFEQQEQRVRSHYRAKLSSISSIIGIIGFVVMVVFMSFCPGRDASVIDKMFLPFILLVGYVGFCFVWGILQSIFLLLEYFS